MNHHLLSTWVGRFITGGTWFITGARSLWIGTTSTPKQRIYFANHTSHADFVLLWSALPVSVRQKTRPVAGADYWLTNRLRKFLIQQVFRGVLVDRARHNADEDPLAPLKAALQAGDSLIFFPEGTRNTGEEPLQLFKSGLYWLSQAHPEVELVPVWISNLNRVMPKGRLIPLPLLCTLSFGTPLQILPNESKDAFLQRARTALLSLSQ